MYKFQWNIYVGVYRATFTNHRSCIPVAHCFLMQLHPVLRLINDNLFAVMFTWLKRKTWLLLVWRLAFVGLIIVSKEGFDATVCTTPFTELAVMERGVTDLCAQLRKNIRGSSLKRTDASRVLDWQLH